MDHPHPGEEHQGRYLFGVLPAGDVLVLEGLEAFEERCPVGLVGVDGLLVLTARVPTQRFGDLPVLRDPERLTALVQDHDRILRRAAASGCTLVPLPFGTVVADDAELVRRVEQSAPALHEALDRLRGCEEYGVHVSVPREVPQRAVRAMASNVHERLSCCAEDAVIEPVAAGATEARPSVLSAAFLVDRRRVGQFEQMVEALRRNWALVGGSITVSGPWPAYHFAGVDLGSPATRESMVLLGPLSSPEHAWVTAQRP
jgi:hypothetical protein